MKNVVYFRYFGFLFLLFISTIGYGQKKDELENQKKSNLEQLKLSRELLESTRQERKSSLYQLNLLNRQIDIRNNLLKTYQEEINFIQRDLQEIEETLRVNERELTSLKEIYAKIIKNSYRNIEQDYFWMYILSSEDINQGYERIRYIKYINDYRRTVYDDISAKNDSLIILAGKLDKIQKEKITALERIEHENSLLYKDKRTKNEIVGRLKGKESELLKEIRERENTQRKIENEIRRIIEEESKRAKTANKIYELTPEERIISDDFTKNRGGLPWPTVQGVITGYFGEHNHPVIRGIKVRSNGIDITTVPNTEVRSIFKGEVTVVSAILGANYTVIIKHGNYRSVYQNLVNVKVKPGELIETKETIGYVGTNSSNESKLHFELWNGMTVINPEIWLSK